MGRGTSKIGWSQVIDYGLNPGAGVIISEDF